MKRSLAAHDIVGTRDSIQKSKSETDISDEDATVSKPTFEVASTYTIDSQAGKQPSADTSVTLSNVKKVSTHNIGKFSTFSNCLLTPITSNSETSYSTAYYRDRCSKEVSSFICDFEESNKSTSSFAFIKEEESFTLAETLTADIFESSCDVAELIPQTKEAITLRYNNKKPDITQINPKLTSCTVGTTTINTSDSPKPEYPIYTINEVTSTETQTKEVLKMGITKPTYDETSLLNVEKSKLTSSVGCYKIDRKNIPKVKSESSGNVGEMISAKRTAKIIHQSPFEIYKQTCSVGSGTMNKPVLAHSNTSKASQISMPRLGGVKIKQKMKNISTHNNHELSTENDKVEIKSTGHKLIGTHDDLDPSYSLRNFPRRSMFEDSSTDTKNKPTYNIVDEVYMRIKKREKASQTEGLQYTKPKKAKQPKLCLESYTQTCKISQDQFMPLQKQQHSKSVSQDHIFSYLKEIEKHYENTEVVKEVNNSMEEDSIVFEQAESTLNVTYESITREHDKTEEELHEYQAAGDQIIQKMLKEKKTDKMNTYPFFSLSMLKNYFISKTVVRKDYEEKISDTFTVKPIEFQNQERSHEKYEADESTETIWSVLKSYISLPFSLKEDIDISEEEDDDINDMIQDTKLEKKQVVRESLKQHITFPSVNKKSYEAQDDPKSQSKSLYEPTYLFFPQMRAAVSAGSKMKKFNAMPTAESAKTPSTSEARGRADRPATAGGGDRPEDRDPPTERRVASGRRRTVDKGLILKPREITGRTIRLGPYETDERKKTLDVGVQTEDDPFNPGRIVFCNCAKFLESQKIKGTGFLPYTHRRIDYVLVVKNMMDHADLEVMKLTYLTGLVKAGFQLEAEEGTVHKDLLFIKLHASDLTLHTYAETFGARKYFTDSHEEMINKGWFEGLPCIRMFRFYEEREWLASMRYWYKRPLRLSNYQRSYIVHMLLMYKTFGENKNFFGLHRLIKNKIVVDAFALHNGPFQRAQHTGNFNGRQVLYSNWAGFINILWLQPLYLIFEYFGSKVGYYFTFYEFYNKALLIAGLWGAFMMWAYQLQDSYSIFTMPIRHHICVQRHDVRNINITNVLEKDFMKKGWYYLWSSLMCAECEGSSETNVCPYLLINDFCFDMKIMQYFENQYIIMYSGGIAFLAILFPVYWRRVEAYWKYIRELDHSGTNLTRPGYKSRQNIANNSRTERWQASAKRCLRGALSSALTDVLLPICIIIIPWMIIFHAFVTEYERTRPMSLKFVQSTIKKVTVVPPIVDKIMEYSVLVVTTFAVSAVLYIIEKIFHYVAYFLTKYYENHRTYEKYEKSLVNCFFWITFNYTVHTIIFFAWLKGTFYSTPISYWDMVFNMSLPYPSSEMLSYNSSALFPPRTAQLLRRAVTLNCFPFSCFRQAVPVMAAVLTCRYVAVRFVETVISRIYAFMISMKTVYKTRMRTTSTVEREYMLQRVPESHYTLSFNTLVSQMAVVFLFAPMFPLAPLVAFAVNMLDIRCKAHALVVNSRRMIYHKAVGIGGWNQIIKTICYAVPLFHVLTIVRTQALIIYMYHKVFQRTWVPQVWIYGEYIRRIITNPKWWFLKFILFSNYIVTRAMERHAGFAQVNYNRVVEREDIKNVRLPGKAMYYSTKKYARVYRCRVNGFLFSTFGTNGIFLQEKFKWPFQWNLIESNLTYVGFEPHHYEWMYYKSLFALVFVLMFALVSLVAWRYTPLLPEHVGRNALRERQLRRLRLPPTKDYRPTDIRRRETKLLHSYY